MGTGEVSHCKVCLMEREYFEYTVTIRVCSKCGQSRRAMLRKDERVHGDYGLDDRSPGRRVDA